MDRTFDAEEALQMLTEPHFKLELDRSGPEHPEDSWIGVAGAMVW